MNFKKLQAMQLELDNSILSAKPQMTAEERFNKTLVALSVEVSEVANCAEHFKFWKDNKGKVDGKRFLRYAEGSVLENLYYEIKFKNTGLTRQQAHKLTLVEEASDCLHFILSLANQIGYEIDEELIKICHYPKNQLETLYVALQNKIMNLATGYDKLGSYKALISFYMSYVNELGITTQELEQAYYEKNEENYRRLREGY